MKKLFILSLIFLISCVSSQVPPKTYNFDKSRLYNLSYDDVWGKIIKWFSEKGTPIKTIEKASGIIATDYNLSANSSKDCLDCGEAKGFGSRITNEYSGNFNVLVEKIEGNKIKVNINTFFSGILESPNWASQYAPPIRSKIDCVSTGILEKDLLDYIEK